MLRFDAACIADHLHHHAPGTLILDRTESALAVLYFGPPQHVPPHLRNIAQSFSYPSSTLLPPFANAHTHLDLTALGPRPHDPADGFAAWLGMIRDQRPRDNASVRASVEQGIKLCLAGGVVAVGDIAGYTTGICIEPYLALAASPLLGVSFLEFFAIGSMQNERLVALEQFLKDHASDFASISTAHARLGIQPHAPYSVSLEAYQKIAQIVPSHIPLSTHLAETAAEHEFIADAAGPHRAFIESLGLWEDSLLESIGLGKSPVEHLAPVLDSSPSPYLLAHCNDCSDSDIQSLACAGASVALCPRAHKYFGHAQALGPHRWQEMLEASGGGMNVCLATDSIVNLDTPDRISPLDDARLVYQDSHADPSTLLRMITANPAKALGMNPDGFGFQAGTELLGVVEVGGASSLDGVMNSSGPPRLALHG